ncbi:MAG TPA: aryl-sulfate sulfotransferase [Polyangiaceae bacterium]
MGIRTWAPRGAHRPSSFATFACILSCLFAAACSDSGDDEPGGGSTDIEVSAEISPAISTVATVTWTTSEAGTGHVEYGPTTALGSTTPTTSTSGTEHSQLLLGLTTDTLYYYRVVTASGAASEVKSIRTGYPPVGVPQIEVEGDGHDQFVLTTFLASGAVIVLNPEGKIVWYLKDDSGMQLVRARLSLDGKSIIYNAARVSGEPSPDSKIVRVSLDGTQKSSVVVPYLAHDFVELPDGTLAAIVVEQDTAGGAELKSNAIVEISADGTITEVWSALDCFDPDVNVSDEPEQGWTLANALDYDPTDDVYYFGSRGLSNISRIPRGMRSCEWVLGATGNTLQFAAGSATFLHQHQFELNGNRLLVHDNDGTMGDASRILEYDLDLTAGTATEIWSFTSTPPVYTPVLGEPMRLENGDTFIDWSYAGQLERVTSTGDTIWKLNAKAGGALGYATLFSSFY